MEVQDIQQERTFDLVGGRLCLDFANTGGSLKSESPREYMQSYSDLVSWGKQAGVCSPSEAASLLEIAAQKPSEAEAVRKRAVRLRQTLHRVFSAISEQEEVRPADLEAFNSQLSSAMRHARIEEQEDGSYVWSWDGGGEALESPLWPVVRSAAELLTSGELSRVRQCAGDTCGWLFVDTTKNHSRQWCDMRDCGNRAKARRHYEKKKASNQ